MPIMLPGQPDKNAWMKTLGEYIALGQQAEMKANRERAKATELLQLKESLSEKVGGVDVINLQTGELEKLPNRDARIAIKTKTHRLASAEELETMKQSVKRDAPPEIIKLQNYLSTLPPNSPKRAAVEKRIKKLTHTKQDSGVPTLGQAKAKIFQKWLNNEELNEKEKRVRRKLFGEKTDAESQNEVDRRWRGKIASFEKSIGRKATIEEIRQMYITDPFALYGDTAPSGGGAGISGNSDSAVDSFINKHKVK